jgi:hypothetical protein
VKLPPSDAFRAQRAHFNLRFNCEDCALFDADTETCAHGFPTEEHRQSYYDDPGSLIVFCKDFDLV